MAAHRYWRVAMASTVGGGDLEIGGFHLLALGVRVDAGAVLSCSTAPVAGAISALQDDTEGTTVRLPARSTLTWDFGPGGDVDITDFQITAGPSPAGFPQQAVGSYSDDGIAWQPDPRLAFFGVVWPGAGAKTSSAHPDGYRLTVTAGDSQVALEEIELKSTPGGASFSPTRTLVYASSEGVGLSSYVAANAFDGLTTTGSQWRGSGSILPVFLGVRFGEPKALQEISLWKGSTGTRPTAFYLSSYTNAREVVLGSWSGETVWTPGVPKTYQVQSLSQMLCTGRVTSVVEPLRIAGGLGQLRYSNQASLVGAPQLRQDYRFDRAARGRIAGTVKRKDTPANVPLSRRVRLYRDRDGMLIRETWSNAQGAYQFDYLEEWEAYTAISYDHTQTYRAVAADNLTLANGGITLIP